MEIIAEIHRIDPDLGILAISGGINKRRMLQAAEKLGAPRSLQKPFTPAEFIGAIKEVMSISAARHSSDSSRQGTTSVSG